jgi:hypothetical protein
MKKTLIAVILSTVLIRPGHALVVSDPGAYSRQAQIIAEAKKQLESIKDVVSQAQRITKNLEGNLKRGRGAEKTLRELKDALEGVMPAMFINGDGEMQDNDIETINKSLDEIFVSVERQPIEAELTAKQREAYRQRSLRAAVSYSEYILADMEQSLNKLENLSNEIDGTNTMKDAQDLNNRFMQEMLNNQTKMIVLMAQLVRAEGAYKLQGVEADETGDRLDYTSQDRTLNLMKYGSRYWAVSDEAHDLMRELQGLEK